MSKIKRRIKTENEARELAMRTKRAVSYLDDDGCEVTAMPDGSIFYNASEWW